MTRDDVSKVVGILLAADGYCGTCASRLLQKFNKEFPGFDDVLDANWAEHFSDSWREDETD